MSVTNNRFINWLLFQTDKLLPVVEEPTEYVKIKETGEIIPFPNSMNSEEYEAYIEEEKNRVKEKGETITAVLKEPEFNADGIIEYKGEGIRKFEFRPEKWEQFIGQEEAKDRVQTVIKKAEMGLKGHIMVNGIKGHGKTTFVELLAKDLEAKLISVVGKQLNEDSLLDIINQINTSTEKHVVFFIDELDSCDWKVIKILNPIIESFRINGKQIKPFIFAGATINKHMLIEKNPDTLDRIPTHVTFSKYNDQELSIILKQYCDQLYKEEKVSAEAIYEIAKNCKYNPRTAIAFLEDYIIEKNIPKVLKNAKIIKNGLAKEDVNLLKILSEAKRPMGANALAMKLGMSQKEYEREYEPFLVEYGYVDRVPSRVITDKGRKFLEDL